MRAGERLKEIRNRLGITTRDVEEYSRRIADAENSDEYYVSNAWLTQVENKIAIPSIFKLYTLSIIYRLKFNDLLQMYGVDLEKIQKYQLANPLPNTHLTNLEVYDKDHAVTFPVRFDPGFKFERTNLLSRMVEEWGEVPVSLIQQLDVRTTSYGYIGLNDYTLYPILRPGSFVQIDDKQTKVQRFSWRNEFERPIYFLELKTGYACAWCEVEGPQIRLVPHTLSQCNTRQFNLSEIDIIGRVTGVAMKLVDPMPNGNGGSTAPDGSKLTRPL